MYVLHPLSNQILYFFYWNFLNKLASHFDLVFYIVWKLEILFPNPPTTYKTY